MFKIKNASPIIFAEPVTDSIYPNEPVPLTDILLKFCVPVNVLFLFINAIEPVENSSGTWSPSPTHIYPSVRFGKSLLLPHQQL